jgi:hypothetical protein
VATSIANGFPSSTYLAEINEFWSEYTLAGQDRVNPKFYQERHLAAARKGLMSLSRGADLVIEKTAANCLRLDFLKALFPDAQFVFVQRDCMQIVKSVLKKQRGNINKISDSEKMSVRSRIARLSERVEAKISIVKPTPRSVLRLVARNFSNVLNILNLKDDIHWGPKFCPPAARKKIMHPEIYAFLQWYASDLQIRKVCEKKSETDIFLDFDNLYYEPLETARGLGAFLGCKNIVFEIEKLADMNVTSDDLEFYELFNELKPSAD